MEPDELHEMVMFLKQELEAGRATISSPGTLDALARVRMGRDGKIDPDSVDGSVRAFARALLGAKTWRALRETPLREVQAAYFDILEDTFGKLFSEAKRHAVSAQQISDHISSIPSAVSAFGKDVDEFAAGLKDFWDTYRPVVEAHLGDLKSLKSVFGGGCVSVLHLEHSLFGGLIYGHRRPA